jgi:hypothetical protein
MEGIGADQFGDASGLGLLMITRGQHDLADPQCPDRGRQPCHFGMDPIVYDDHAGRFSVHGDP